MFFFHKRDLNIDLKYIQGVRFTSKCDFYVLKLDTCEDLMLKYNCIKYFPFFCLLQITVTLSNLTYYQKKDRVLKLSVRRIDPDIVNVYNQVIDIEFNVET